jgi:NAD(P)-dependent dehydrogenase (short-subunit alcohol dehydrogenase family)
MVFFVTGGSRGIGSGIVLAAARSGHDVAFTYANNADAARDVLNKAREINPDAKYKAYKLDVCHSAEVEKVGEAVLEDFDTIDMVVANAGINKNNLLVSMSDQEWHDVLDTNLSGAFYVCRFFLTTFLVKRSGRLVLISSVGARGVSGQGNYAASKAGLLGLSGTIAREYGKKGITCNVVSPGFFETDMTREGMSEANRNWWLQFCPIGRLGKLPEIAELVVFLSTPEAGFINGQELRVNGGLEWAP